MVPVTATAPPTPSAVPDDHHQPQPADIDAEALRGLLAEAERAKGVALAPQDDRARHDERQRQHDVPKAAVLQRAEQPERDFQHHEGIAGQIHHQSGRGARQAGDRKARQNENQQPRIAAGDRQQREHRREGHRDRGDRQRVGAHIGKPERDHQHRAERGRLRRAEQRRRRQRIAQQSLQRRAGQSRGSRRSQTPEWCAAAGSRARSPAPRRCRRRTAPRSRRAATAAPGRCRARSAPAARTSTTSAVVTPTRRRAPISAVTHDVPDTHRQSLNHPRRADT